MKRIAFQGEQGAFSELAAIEFFGTNNKFVPLPEFEDVFKEVALGKYNYGVIPIENSLAGSIHQNYDMLLEHNLCIQGEIYLRISHFLIANKGVPRKNIKRIFSHPQALAQCRAYLKKRPLISSIPFSNTALAVKKIKEESLLDAAAIGSMQAAIDYEMDILAGNIADNKWNTTRFIILSRTTLRAPKTKVPMKTSIVFSTKNIPGALFKCLGVFALRDIDLFKIESRPVHGKGFEYLFYLDFAGNIRDEAQQNAISHLQEISTVYRLLGSYPAGRLAHPEYLQRNLRKAMPDQI